jgi:colanic acid/amylovoran biosynthesis glycosyltransferase
MTNSIPPSLAVNHPFSERSSRLVLVVKEFPRRSETFIVQKFLGLLEQGWDVHIVCERSSVKDWSLFPQLLARKDSRHRVHVIRPARPKLIEILLFPFSFLRFLLLAPKRTLIYLGRGWKFFGPYILHLFQKEAEFVMLQPALIHYEFGSLAPGRMHLKDLLNCRITVSFRGSDIIIDRFDKPDFYRQVWEQADALHLLGKDLWNRALQRDCPIDKPHTLISPAIDTTFFSRRTTRQVESVGIPSRPYRILSVGRLEWTKGYEYAMQAVKWLVDQGIPCEYHIIGSGYDLYNVEFTRIDLGLKNVVTLLGPQSRLEVKEQMEWADVFFHAAVLEGFCNAVMEAQAMTLPVICSDAEGLSENVANDQTGFVIPRRDWHTMAEKLALLAADPKLRGRMGDAGRQRVIQKFNLDAQISSFSKFYREVLSK